MQQGHGPTRNDAAIANARRYCEQTGTPLPFRPRQDISTVEGCIRAIEGAKGSVSFGNTDNRGTIFAHPRNGRHWKFFGTWGVSWTLADLQAAARYVLGIVARIKA